MEELYYSKTKREVPLSHYEIVRSPITNNPGFRGNVVSTIKPGTFLGFCESSGRFVNTSKR